jgi:DmsE family decaheme c-type cytochrome
LTFAAALGLSLAITAASPAVGQERAGYAGNEACIQCHKEQVATFAATRKGNLFSGHPRDSIGRLGCEGCHGPAKTHAESGGDERGGLISYQRNDPTPVEQRNDLCLRCHQGGARFDWAGGAHESRDIACTDCHRIMVQVSERSQLNRADVTETCAQCHQQRRAQMARFAHMPVREGKMDCAGCHNPHGTPTEKLLKAPSVNELCYTCHTEKRGPFLWEHAPVAENCSNCHDPHGSSNDKLLTVPRARLCQRCHDESQHPTRPYSADAANSRFIFGRQCQNCHFSIHGSNHPSGARFTR